MPKHAPYRQWRLRRAGAAPAAAYRASINNFGETEMPILLWLLGVPLIVVILLRVFGMI